MPGTALPIERGGMGFDYRLAMNIDFWIKLIKSIQMRLGDELYLVGVYQS